MQDGFQLDESLEVAESSIVGLATYFGMTQCIGLEVW